MLEKEYWYAVLNQSAKKAGVEASIDVYHTDIHAFDMWRPRLPESQEAIRKFEVLNREDMLELTRIKTADKERQWESEEVYDFLIAAVGPLTGEYEMHTPPKSWIRKYAQK